MPRKKGRSSFAEWFYNFRYRCGEYALRGFIASLPHLPPRLVAGFTKSMAWVTFVLLWKYRKRMAENVASVLGSELGCDQQKVLVWRAWLNFARGVLETMTVMHLSRHEIIGKIKLEGEEYLKRALETHNGVLAISAHLGSFTLIGARLAAAGYPFSVIVKQPADKRFAQLIDDYRAQLDIHTISAKPRREAAREILKALRNNRIVLIIADEFKSGDVMVDFFQMKAPAPRGPATLALRTGAVTLPIFAVRGSDDSVVLTVDPAIPSEKRGDIEESVVATTALYTRHIEAAIRKYPDQWNWLGLPRRDGRMSRSEMARIAKEARAAADEA
ncbi:MAG TPA: lysophospholipid acyltransferase family protein [Candidatus Binatia bacterium]